MRNYEGREGRRWERGEGDVKHRGKGKEGKEEWNREDENMI